MSEELCHPICVFLEGQYVLFPLKGWGFGKERSDLLRVNKHCARSYYRDPKLPAWNALPGNHYFLGMLMNHKELDTYAACSMLRISKSATRWKKCLWKKRLVYTDTFWWVTSLKKPKQRLSWQYELWFVVGHVCWGTSCASCLLESVLVVFCTHELHWRRKLWKEKLDSQNQALESG